MNNKNKKDLEHSRSGLQVFSGIISCTCLFGQELKAHFLHNLLITLLLHVEFSTISSVFGLQCSNAELSAILFAFML